MTTRRKKPEFYECGICSCWHSAAWNGDCREDAARFFPDDLGERYGADGWREVPMPGGEPAPAPAPYEPPRRAHARATAKTRATIAKLRNMTVERGCPAPEAASAQAEADRLEAGLRTRRPSVEVGAGEPGDLADYACPECGATVQWRTFVGSAFSDDGVDVRHWYCTCGATEPIEERLRYWDEATNDGFRFPLYHGGREIGYTEVLVRPETYGRRCGR